MKFSIYRIRVRVTPLRVTTVVRTEVRAKFVIVVMINRVVFVKQLSYTVKVI